MTQSALANKTFRDKRILAILTHVFTEGYSMRQDTKVGSITDSHGIVMAVVYQHRDGSIDAGDIGNGRDMDDLQRLLPNGFTFRPCKDALRGQSHNVA